MFMIVLTEIELVLLVGKIQYLDFKVSANNEQHRCCVELDQDKGSRYSRTSVARTLMARSPRLFRTRSGVPRKKSHSYRFGIFRMIFFFYIAIGILCVLIRITSMRRC